MATGANWMDMVIGLAVHQSTLLVEITKWRTAGTIEIVDIAVDNLIECQVFLRQGKEVGTFQDVRSGLMKRKKSWLPVGVPVQIIKGVEFAGWNNSVAHDLHQENFGIDIRQRKIS